MLEQPNYYAIIPANVRYADITPNAKLLYGEITALSNKNGCCYAGNEYFANLYNVSKVSVSKWVSELVKNGFITSDITYKEGSKEILNRCLRIIGYPLKENFLHPIKEKFKENNTSSINNTRINNNSIPDDHFEEWYRVYPRHISKANAKKAYTTALKKVGKEILLGAVKVFAKSVEINKTEERFIPHPSTWLNQERWEDYKPKSVEVKNNIPMGIRLIDGYWVDLYTDRKLFSVVDNPNPDWNKFDKETRSF
jgi:hypothetical protein